MQPRTYRRLRELDSHLLSRTTAELAHLAEALGRTNKISKNIDRAALSRPLGRRIADMYARAHSWGSTAN